MFKVGDAVSKQGGDYTFDGIVVVVFPKLSGQVRYVVENAQGLLHIFSGKQLALRGEKWDGTERRKGEQRKRQAYTWPSRSGIDVSTTVSTRKADRRKAGAKEN